MITSNIKTCSCNITATGNCVASDTMSSCCLEMPQLPVQKECTLKKIVCNYPTIAERLFENLSASYVSLLSCMIGYNMSKGERKRYLNPLRDLPEYKEWIEKEVALGSRVLLISKSSPSLIARILHPMKYWNSKRTKDEKIRILVFCFPGNGEETPRIPKIHMNDLNPMSLVDHRFIKPVIKEYKIRDDQSLSVLFTSYTVLKRIGMPSVLRLNSEELNTYYDPPIVSVKRGDDERNYIFTSSINIHNGYFSMSVSSSEPYGTGVHNDSAIILAMEDLHSYTRLCIDGNDGCSHKSKNMDPLTLRMTQDFALPGIRNLFVG
ncbi:uncharacterized protein PV06_11918 [Exophiala oligosperma]|uniref:Uncharacterized protein n=1 Tax=Exophiala oligosperma TaxID=215243 RepID=A0A0D2A5V1_9EURO|nr:uncharacterized protein PV06_11918 [Exophiala oligosperma]KIW35741.1 hypothetical protein PV06_11918 [Exophiala oligosperma]